MKSVDCFFNSSYGDSVSPVGPPDCILIRFDDSDISSIDKHDFDSFSDSNNSIYSIDIPCLGVTPESHVDLRLCIGILIILGDEGARSEYNA